MGKKKKKIIVVNFLGFFELVKLMRFCGYQKCRKMFVKKKCSKCKNVWYCCRNHQKKDWNAIHRSICC